MIDIKKYVLKEKNNRAFYVGLIALLIGLFFAIWLVVPNIVGSGNMAKESFFIFVMWALAGFIYFRYAMKKDKTRC